MIYYTYNSKILYTISTNIPQDLFYEKNPKNI